MHDFNVEPDIKSLFLNEKQTGTAKDNKNTLKLVDKYEFLINKSVYDMSFSELVEMLSIQFRNSSMDSLKKNRAIISSYINFCRRNNLVYHMENRIEFLTDDDLNSILNKEAIKFKYISYEKKTEYQKMLPNNQDKLILECPYYGIRGRTTIDGTLEEIINLRIDFDKIESGELKQNELILIKNNGLTRRLEVKEETMDLIYKTFDEDIYIGISKCIPINKLKNFVFRVPGKNKFNYFDPMLINSRMSRIQKIVGNDYLTITDLYFSGMINMARELLKEKSFLTFMDINEICDKFEYSRNYMSKIKAKIEEYLNTEVINT